uniref:ATP-dependent DNA helicase n=1 Tax=Cacopsylla melanoneura TaxID=428564 RepID=A0A8D8YUF1_9HEMI
MLSSKKSSVHNDEESRLSSIEKELSHVNKEIKRLTERRNQLIASRNQLKDDILLKKSNKHCSNDWDKNDYPWSSQVKSILKTKFKLNEFRTNQLAAINITLLKKDAIIIMPTGSGKSLCFQLPALIDKGTTLVISPMISLMEDQLGHLRRLNIEAEMLQASNTRQENNRVMKLMTDSTSLKLLYVSPEKLAKSKTFMSKLQKMYKAGTLARIAIDEVHCCSTWGHDFRPDYQYLSILKTMFPEVPILGLTATATTKVMLDVQKMLQIEGCIVLQAPFNRPNLYYEVRKKPSSQKECLDELSDLMNIKFKGQSGIIYTTSIKECEDLRDELRKRGLRVSAYHAKLEPELRSKVHSKWLSGEYQAVTATIAFGLGIDKPNVRFVIHHCLSKSMENFYQESGRAGRDGHPSHCILYYRLGDVLKLSPMVFESQTGLLNLYNIVDYCLDRTRCRRAIIASYFDQPWSDTECNKMCDHCAAQDGGGLGPKKVDISKHARTLCIILNHVSDDDINVTAAMLMDLWYKQKVAKVKNVAALSSFQAPTFARETGENIIAHLLINNYLKQDFHFTPYSTISYLKLGPKARLLDDKDQTVVMTIAGKVDKTTTTTGVKKKENKTEKNEKNHENKNEKDEKNHGHRSSNEVKKNSRTSENIEKKTSNDRKNVRKTTDDDNINAKKNSEKSHSSSSLRNTPNKCTNTSDEISIVSEESTDNEDLVELSEDDGVDIVENIETVTLGEEEESNQESVVGDDEQNSEDKIQVGKEINRSSDKYVDVKRTHDEDIDIKHDTDVDSKDIEKGNVEKSNNHSDTRNESSISERNSSKENENSPYKSSKASTKRKVPIDEDEEDEKQNEKRRQIEKKVEEFLQDQKRRRTDSKGNASSDSLQDMRMREGKRQKNVILI